MAKNDFYLKVISTNGVFYSGRVVNLIIPDVDGAKGIEAHHESMVIAVVDGIMIIQPTEGGEWIEAAVGRGFCWVANNRVQLLTETAEKPEDINIRRAEEARERAKEHLRQKQSLEEYYHNRAALSRAMARLRAANANNKDI